MQHDVFSQVMNPLVDDLLLGGKSGLLVAMGPTGSGKTHTVFGSPRNPGLVPLTLRRIFSPTTHEPFSKLRYYTLFKPKPTLSFNIIPITNAFIILIFLLTMFISKF
jgi:hypothetical protein